MESRSAVTEGVYTARAVMNLAKTLNIDLPIMAGIYGLLHKDLSAEQVIEGLLSRPFGDE